MVSLLERLRKASLDDVYEITTEAGEIEEKKFEIKLSQTNDGTYDYLSVDYPNVSKEKLKDYLERNRFFRTALASTRLQQLKTDRYSFPLFEMSEYGNQNSAAYVFYEIDNLKKIYTDGKIMLVKSDTEKVTERSSSKTPTFTVLPKRSPAEKVTVLKGRGRGR